MRPEDAPILIHVRKQGETAFGSGAGLTHIPVNRGTLTHIPVAAVNSGAPANSGGLTHIPVNTQPMDHLPMAGTQDPLPGEVIGPDGVPMMQQPGVMTPGEGGTSPTGEQGVSQLQTLHTSARRRHR
jgi:hypothetical protein